MVKAWAGCSYQLGFVHTQLCQDMIAFCSITYSNATRIWLWRQRQIAWLCSICQCTDALHGKQCSMKDQLYKLAQLWTYYSWAFSWMFNACQPLWLSLTSWWYLDGSCRLLSLSKDGIRDTVANLSCTDLWKYRADTWGRWAYLRIWEGLYYANQLQGVQGVHINLLLQNCNKPACQEMALEIDPSEFAKGPWHDLLTFISKAKSLPLPVHLDCYDRCWEAEVLNEGLCCCVQEGKLPWRQLDLFSCRYCMTMGKRHC